MKNRESMTFDLDHDQFVMLEIISKRTGIPVDVLIVQAHVLYGEKMCPDLPWPREPSSENE